MVHHMLVAVGHHGAASVPAPASHDVHRSGQERVGVAHDRPDVQVVLPVLHRHMERMAPPVEVGGDGLDAPIAVAVGDVAPVTLGQQRRIEPVVVGPGWRQRSDTDLVRPAAAFNTGVVRVSIAWRARWRRPTNGCLAHEAPDRDEVR